MLVLQLQIFTLGTWRKQKTVGTPFGSVEDLLDSESTTEQTSTAKRKHLKTKSASRKKLEDIFPISRKIPDGTPSEQSLPIDIVVQEFETKPVDIEALRAGMARFRFLLHGCQPGSVPDPKIVASMLDLVSLNLYLETVYPPLTIYPFSLGFQSQFGEIKRFYNFWICGRDSKM